MKHRIVNINYKGRVLESVDHLTFNQYPTQCVWKLGHCTLIIFKNRKCRIMGLKQPLTTLQDLPLKIFIERMQSVTVVMDMEISINLHKLALSNEMSAELFPAVKMKKFKPIHVNVFHTGKVVITGLKTLDYYPILCKIFDEIKSAAS